MAKQDKHLVTLNDELIPDFIPASEMKPGEYGVVTEGPHRGRVVGRIWATTMNANPDAQRFFAVDNPSSTWNDPRFVLRLLKAGERFTVVVGEDE
jgi:hypothetical protein